MLSTERIPIVLIDSRKSDREDFRTCVAGSRFKVWTDAQHSDSLLPLYRTLSPSLAVIDMDATPKVKGGPTALQAIEELLKEIPTARVVVSHTLERKFLLGGFFQAGARGNVMRPYTVDRVLDGIGMALANRQHHEAGRDRQPDYHAQYRIVHALILPLGVGAHRGHHNSTVNSSSRPMIIAKA